MAINFTRLFTTLGKVVGGLNEANTYRGATVGARTDTLSARFDSALQPVAEGLYPARDDGRKALDRWVRYLTDLASDTIVAEVDADRKLVSPTLSNSILELDRQMRASGESLADSPASVAIVPSLTDGTAVMIGTALQPDGVAAQLALADTYLATVPRGYLGGDTQYQEVVTVTGTRESVPSTSWEWPGGSGVQVNLSSRDPHYNLGLTNGRLSLLTGWTAAPLADWSNVAAVTPPRSGYTSNVTLLTPSGASGTLSQVVNIQGRTVYAWTLKVFKDGGVQNWSVLVRLKDGAGVTIPGLTFTVAAGALAAGWNTLAGFFVTPQSWAGDASFEAGYSAIVTQTNLQLAHAALVPTAPIYPGGPTLVIWSGTKPLTTKDLWTANVTIGGTGALHRGIDRLVNLQSVLVNGLPVSGAPTQADALVS